MNFRCTHIYSELRYYLRLDIKYIPHPHIGEKNSEFFRIFYSTILCMDIIIHHVTFRISHWARIFSRYFSSFFARFLNGELLL